MIDLVDRGNVARWVDLWHIGVRHLGRLLVQLTEIVSPGYGLGDGSRCGLPSPRNSVKERCRAHLDLIKFGGISR
ncbi:hypothetical protein [Mycobacteroides chelonae]|uniref:hypothetical protein n=1 Tax=Mycobacteroides chelonae TaxID=1774 RepID=UPI0018E34828|nr:hypothetical protein [Mycobacteroides chelonae]